MKITNRIYQFKVSLREISPVVWRRIQVPTNYDFWDLHVALQDSMGWFDCHLHQFSIKRPHARKITEIGIPQDAWGGDDDDVKTLTGWEVKLSDYFSDLGVSAFYRYDFGDSWDHDVQLEALLIRENGVKYPRCVAGEQACPPEDCGGYTGYFNFLAAALNPAHEDHKNMIAWYGKEFDPNAFNAQDVQFDNPKKRWRVAFQQQ